MPVAAIERSPMAPATRSKAKENPTRRSGADLPSCGQGDEARDSSLSSSGEDNDYNARSVATDETFAEDDGGFVPDVSSSRGPVRQTANRGTKARVGRLKGMDIKGIHFKEPLLTEGGAVKAGGEVLTTYYAHFERTPNIKCRVETFGRIIKGFNGKKKQWVQEMGFGPLLQIGDLRLPRKMCYWLMTRLDPIDKRLVFHDGTSFPLSANQVQWILGIPSGEKQVPLKMKGNDMVMKLDFIERKFGTSPRTKKKAGCLGKFVIEVSTDFLQRVEDDWTDGPEDEFKLAFLIMALHLLLCPTQASTLASDLHPALTTFDRCASYDWAQLVLDRLFKSGMTFARTFYKNGFSGGSGGCTFFLAIFYLDRLRRPPVRWGYYPRIGAWTCKLVNEAKLADKRKEKHGDFGVLGCVKAAYGEVHSMEATDRAPPTSTGNINVPTAIVAEVVRLLTRQSISTEESNIRAQNEEDSDTPPKKRRKATSLFNPQQRKNELKRKNDLIKTALPHQSDPVVTPSTSQAPSPTLNVSPSLNPQPRKNDLSNTPFPQQSHPTVTPLISPASSPTLNVYPSLNLKGGDVRVDPGGTPLVDTTTENMNKGEVSHVGSKSRERRILKRNRNYPSLNETMNVKPKVQKKLLKYVRRRAHEDDSDIEVLLECDGQFCTVSDCASLIGKEGEVSNTYIRTVALLYTKAWRSKFAGRSSRCMFDSDFTDLLLKINGDPKRSLMDAPIVKKVCNTLKGCISEKGIHDVSEVFLPALEELVDDSEKKQMHWWCLALLINLSQVRIIDSNTDDAIVEHANSILKIVSAMDDIFSSIDSAWEKDQMVNWPKIPLKMTQQRDSHSCGIIMLLAIKRCAIRYESELILHGQTQQMRNFLLYDDLTSPANEVWESVKSRF